ncbi:stage V sporulation protein AA [Halanaerobacter jeridensis]|uniref:Stage V sporulation protein AA n=1 Tax=Halanaerobacter jeridensis TaxID=706427 RepID=A0A938XN10_9FIRM|nr:stage V sporulation protein AA [Halanaerobacter jeridensis]MBM7555268.1 stage V sporulation protein AA [Halanaerobacter jeridensis]
MNNELPPEIFLKLKNDLTAYSGQDLLLSDLVNIIAPPEIEEKLKNILIKTVKQKPETSIVVSSLEVITAIKDKFPKASLKHLGTNNLVIDVVAREPSNNKSLLSNTQPSFLVVCLVGIVLFIGSGMAIMHFHADVNIKQVHQEVYQMIMGQEKNNPLLLEIPYSLGIACGMIIFFNNFLSFKFDSDPSPLEIEMFLYEDKINQYAIYKKEELDSS